MSNFRGTVINLDLSLREEARPDFKQDTLVLLQRPHSALDDCAGLGAATVQLCLELCQRSLGPVNSQQ